MKTTEENNRMIAEFMGYKMINDLQISTPNNGGAFLSELKYHTSWDWLMSVIDRIKDLEVNTRDKDIVLKLTLHHSLDDVYYCVCKFIEWYNEQEKL